MANATRDHRLRDYARNNRKEMNEAEVRIWTELRRRVLDVRFRRQHVIGPYILDFACVALRLAVELDGSQHEASPDDTIRDAYLTARGWTVLRFWSWEALSDTEAVINAIIDAIDQLQKAR